MSTCLSLSSVKDLRLAVLPHDTYSRDWGLFVADHLPYIPGSNVAGSIEKLGPNVTSFNEGDRVFGCSDYPPEPDQTGLQQYAVLDAAYIAKVPEHFTNEQAATLPTNLITSWAALFTSQGFKLPAPFSKEGKNFDYKGETVVIIGAGSNAGKFGIQLAKIAGIGTIVAVAGSANKDALTKMGATHFVDRHANIAEQTLAITGPEGATHVYDCANVTAEPALSLLSTTKPSLLRNLVPVQGEEGEKLKSQRPLCDAQMLHNVRDYVEPSPEVFWAHVPKWLEEGKVLPTDFSVIEGLDKVEEINAAMDGYRDFGRSGMKQVIVKV